MMRIFATAAFVAAILWLQYLNWEKKEKTSKALWIPFFWLLLAGSRSFSAWFGQPAGVSQEERYLEGTPLDAAIFGVLILCGVLVLNRRFRQLAAFFRGNAALLLFFAYCAVSIAWSGFPQVALKHWIKMFGDLVMVPIVLTDLNPEAAIRRVLSNAALVLLPLSVLLILVFPELGSSLNLDDHTIYFHGVTTQKNEMGMNSLVFGLGTLWSLLRDWEERGRPGRRGRLFVQGVVLLTALWLLFKANSMTSFACLVLSSTIMVVAVQRWVGGRSSYIYSMVGGAIGLAVFAVLLDSSGVLLRLLGRNPTLTGRTEIWRAVLSFHTDPLIGTGFDSFWLGSRIRGVANQIGYGGINQAHNGYLELYINLGWIGLIFFAGMIASGYRSVVRSFLLNPRLGSLRLAFLCASVMYSLSEAGFRALIPIWFVCLLAIVEVPLRRPRLTPYPSLGWHFTNGAQLRRARRLR